MNNAGLPGTGIGGFFYLLMAFFMPFREFYLTLSGRSSLARWRLVLRQLSIAGGVLVGVEGAGWGLSRILHIQRPAAKILGRSVVISHLFIVAPVVLSLVTLVLVLGAIRVWAIADRLLDGSLGGS